MPPPFKGRRRASALQGATSCLRPSKESRARPPATKIVLRPPPPACRRERRPGHRAVHGPRHGPTRKHAARRSPRTCSAPTCIPSKRPNRERRRNGATVPRFVQHVLSDRCHANLRSRATGRCRTNLNTPGHTRASATRPNANGRFQARRSQAGVPAVRHPKSTFRPRWAGRSLRSQGEI